MPSRRSHTRMKSMGQSRMFGEKQPILAATVKDMQRTLKRSRVLFTVAEHATVVEAARIMSDNQIGALVVLSAEQNFVGVLTERDILSKVTTTHTAPHNLLVGQIMTAQPISCTMDTSLENVQQLMAQHKIRHLPILVEGRPVAMVSSRDLIAYQLHSSKAMRVAAEQLAMLSTELKNLSLKDVVALALNDVPRTFDAERAVLCLPKGQGRDIVIYRNQCPLARKDLLAPDRTKELEQNNRVRFADCPRACKESRAEGPRLLIPLMLNQQHREGEAQTQTQSMLCMCCLASSPQDMEKPTLYKASLLQEILSLNLTNATLYKDYQRARQDSTQDPLTQVGSRRILDQVLQAEHERSSRYGRPFSVAIVDIDKFKEINDTAGHAAGDNALRHVARLMTEKVRTTDTVIIRYGGDEFVLLLPETALNEATILLERLRRQVAGVSIPGAGKITISCGVAEWAHSRNDIPEKILSRADRALYEAKRKGRNRVIAAGHSILSSEY